MSQLTHSILRQSSPQHNPCLQMHFSSAFRRRVPALSWRILHWKVIQELLRQLHSPANRTRYITWALRWIRDQPGVPAILILGILSNQAQLRAALARTIPLRIHLSISNLMEVAVQTRESLCPCQRASLQRHFDWTRMVQHHVNVGDPVQFVWSLRSPIARCPKE